MMLFQKQGSRQQYMLLKKLGGVDKILVSCKPASPKPQSPVLREMRPQSPPARKPRVVGGLCLPACLPLPLRALSDFLAPNFRTWGFASGSVLA